MNSDGFCSECNLMKEPEIDTNGDLIIERYEKTNEINKNKVKRTIRIDIKGNFIVRNGDNDFKISNEYQIARDFYCGLACVQNKNGFWGAVNERSELIVPFDYLMIQSFNYERTFAVNKYRQLCLLSSSGTVLKEFESSWDTYSCHPFEGEYAVIEKDKKLGLIDKSGQEILRIAYEHIDIKKDKVVVEVKDVGECNISLDGKFCFINNQTLLLPDWCICIKQISEELYSALSLDGKWGIINKTSEILCDPIYDEINDIRDDIIVGVSHVQERIGWSYRDVIKYGLYNATSGVTLPAIYDEIPEIKYNYYKIKKHGLCGLLKLNGDVFLKPEYEDITYSKGYFVVSKRTADGTQQGLLNTHGEIVIEPIFDTITILKKGLFRICKERLRRSDVPTKWTLFNNEGSISEEFDEMGKSVKNGYIKVKKNGKSGFINENGSIIIHSEDSEPIELPEKFSWGEDFKEGIAAVWINETKNYVDKDFNLVINNNGRVIKILTDIDYVVSIDYNQNYLFSYQKKLGLLSNDGRLLISPRYDSLKFFSENLYLASIIETRESEYSCEHFGLISTDDEEVLPVIYESIKPFSGTTERDIEDAETSTNHNNTDSIKYWVIEKGYYEKGLIDKAGNIYLEAIFNSIIIFENIFIVQKTSESIILDENFNVKLQMQVQGSISTIKRLGRLFWIEYFTETWNNESYILDENFNLKLYLKDTDSIVPYDGKVHITNDKNKDYNEDYYSFGLSGTNVQDSTVPSKEQKYWLFNKRHGLIDDNGNICINDIYQDIVQLYGLFDDNGSICINAIYQNIVQFEHGFYVKHNDKWGILNDKFEVITEPKYNSIINYSDGYKKVTIKETKYYDYYENWSYDYVTEGIIDELGREIIEPRYKILSCGEENISIIVSQEKELNKYGLMNEKFEIFVQPDYSYISEFQNGKALAIKQINDTSWSEDIFLCGYLDKSGAFLDFFNLIDVKNGIYPDRIKEIFRTVNNLIILQIIDEKPSNQYCAIVNQEGKVIVPFVFHIFEPCEGNIFKAGVFCDNYSSTYEWHLLDSSFNELTHEPCKSINPIHSRYVITLVDGKVGLIDNKGKVLLPFIFSSISEAGENRLWIEEYHDNEYEEIDYGYKYNQKYGLASLDGEVLIEPTFRRVNPFVNNRAIVLSGNYGVIDFNGNEIIPLKYQDIMYDSESKQFVVTKYFPNNSYEEQHKKRRFNINGFHIIKDSDGNDIIASKKFHWQDDYDENSHSVVYKDGEEGIVNNQFQMIFKFHLNDEEKEFLLPDEYDWGTIASDDFIIVEKHNKKGVLSTNNKLIIDCLYDKIEYPSGYEGLFLCATLNANTISFDSDNLDYQWTFVNKDGVTLFSNLSQSSFILMGTFIAIKGDNKYLIYDCNGHLVTKNQFDVVCCFSNHSHASDYSIHSDLEQDGLYAIVGANDRFGAINRLGLVVIPIEYKSLILFENNQFEGDGCLRNILGQRIISNNEFTLPMSEEYDDAKICENGLIIVRQDYHYGCVTQDNKIIIPTTYDELECHDRFFIATKYEDYYYHKIGIKAVINYSNEVIISFDHYFTEIVISNHFIKVGKCNEQETEWGAFSFEGEKICGAIYDEIEYFANNLIKVGVYNKRYGKVLYGLIDFKGNEILPLKYSLIGNNVENGRIPIKSFKYEKVGFIDVVGNVLLEPIYSTIGLFIDGFAIVSKQYYDRQEDKKCSVYGVIDCSCNVVIPCLFKNIHYEKELGLFRTEKGYKMPDGRSIIDHQGTRVVINGKYADCSDFNNDCAIATFFDKGEKRFGLINTKSEDILPPIFQSFQYMDFGLFVFKLNGKWGVVDCNGNFVLANQYDGICKFDENLAIIKIKNNVTNKGEIDSTLYGYINSEGRIVLPAEFSFIGKRSENYSVVRSGLDCTWGLFNRESQKFMMIENASFIGPCQNGLCRINYGGHFDRVTKKTDGGKWGYINIEGKTILHATYDFIGQGNENYSVIRRNQSWGLFHLVTHEVKMVREASCLGPCNEGLCRINIGGTYDIKTKGIIGGKWGFFDPDNGIAIEPKYSMVMSFSDDMAAVKLDNGWGFINKRGDVVVPCEYDELISSYSFGKGKLLKKNKVYIFNKEGNILSSHSRNSYDDYGYDDYDTPTYDKYGGYNGYDDQTIDEVFGGDPNLTWNID